MNSHFSPISRHSKKKEILTQHFPPSCIFKETLLISKLPMRRLFILAAIICVAFSAVSCAEVNTYDEAANDKMTALIEYGQALKSLIVPQELWDDDICDGRLLYNDWKISTGRFLTDGSPDSVSDLRISAIQSFKIKKHGRVNLHLTSGTDETGKWMYKDGFLAFCIGEGQDLYEDLFVFEAIALTGQYLVLLEYRDNGFLELTFNAQ